MATLSINRGEFAGAVQCTWAVRLLPSLTDVAFVLPAAGLFLKMNGAKTLLGDGDTGWHIRAGEWMLAHHAVPHKDLFSYTRPDAPWYAWEWLWDAGAAWLHQRWGLAGVVLASLLVLCLTSALLYRLTLKKCGNPLVAIALTGTALVASSLHWLARPHLLTLLLTVVFYWILENVRDGRTTLLWLLPPLTLLWTNLHGGFLVALILLGAYSAGEFLSAALRPDASLRGAGAAARPYMLTGLACFLTTFLNPYTYRLHAHIFDYLTDPYHFENIGEFLSISFHSPATRAVELLLLLGALAAVWSMRNRDFTNALLTLGWAHLALLSGRNIPLYAIVALPPAARMIRCALDGVASAEIAQWARTGLIRFRAFGAEIAAVERLPRLYLGSVAVCAFMAAALLLPFPSDNCRAEYDPKAYPAQAIPFLRSLGASARIYTDDEWGDYLAYNGFKVFIDGRSDFYGSDFGKKYIPVLRGEYTWRKRLAAYKPDTILLRVENPLTATLKEARDWRTAYDDGRAIVFRALPVYNQFAAAACSGTTRDRAIAETQPGDLRITPYYARR